MIAWIRAHVNGISVWVLTVLIVVLPSLPYSQSIEYRLRYSGNGDHRVAIAISFPLGIQGSVNFVMPRNYPGGYNLVLYDSFVENIRALSAEGKSLTVKRETDGPRWIIQGQDQSLRRIEYDVDVNRMEQVLQAGIDSSKVRSQYLGILGYSVFGYIDGLQDRKIELHIEGPKAWPVLTTLSPSIPASLGIAKAEADNYYALADSQILMGPDLQLRLVKGKITLILAAYVETEEDLAIESQIARDALDGVEAYFGNAPFSTYTVQLELLNPLAGHDYGFSQEHLNSGTFSLANKRAITSRSTAEQRQATLFNYAHHMAHCWIPKRSYGVGYLPFTWEMPPVIDTIWFNEGFARYAAIEALAEAMPSTERLEFRRTQLSRLHTILDDAPPFIREMPLLVLSREASFIYSLDFRIGMSTFARGALMAAEIDDRIRSGTEGKKNLRDGFRFLLQWSETHHRAFTNDELRALLSQASGVDLSDIFDHWMQPNPR